MRTLAVISRKGGVGKTTLSVNLAMAAYDCGLKTLVADLDSQRSAQAWAAARTVPGPAVVATTAGKVFPVWSSAVNGFAMCTASAFDKTLIPRRCPYRAGLWRLLYRPARIARL